MDLTEYQRRALDTVKDTSSELRYLALGLAGEAGEVANNVKKIYRDDRSLLTIDRRRQVEEELGDVLWYVAVLAKEINADLGTVAEGNLAKLQRRYELPIG